MWAPLVAVGDGALGFSTAVPDVWPETSKETDRCHKIANVLDSLPKRLQGKAKSMLRDAIYVETQKQAEEQIDVVSALGISAPSHKLRSRIRSRSQHDDREVRIPLRSVSSTVDTCLGTRHRTDTRACLRRLQRLLTWTVTDLNQVDQVGIDIVGVDGEPPHADSATTRRVAVAAKRILTCALIRPSSRHLGRNSPPGSRGRSRRPWRPG